jgi:predicted transcriptional regulator
LTGAQIKKKRVLAGITGGMLCSRASFDRSRLSHIERGYIQASEAELSRIDNALEELIRVKRELAKTATRLGWPLSAL